MRNVSSIIASVAALGLLLVGGSGPSRATTVMRTSPAFVTHNANRASGSFAKLKHFDGGSWRVYYFDTQRSSVVFGQMAAGPGGRALWLTDPYDNVVFQIRLDGAIRGFPLSFSNHGTTTAFQPQSIASGADEKLYVTGSEAPSGSPGRGLIGVLSTSGSFVVRHPRSGDLTYGVTPGPDGNVWFVETQHVGRITPNGAIAEFLLPPGQAVNGGSIVAGSDGNLWFTGAPQQPQANPVFDKIDPTTGSVTSIGGGGCQYLGGLTNTPSGMLYTFCIAFSHNTLLARVTTGGTFQTFELPQSLNIGLTPIATLNGDIWFPANDGANNLLAHFYVRSHITKLVKPAVQAGITLVLGPSGNIWTAGATSTPGLNAVQVLVFPK